MRRQLNYIIVSWIFGVISACIHPEVCFNTKQQNCNSAILCEHGDCYRTTKSMTIDPETVGSTKNCPQNFDKYKEYCFHVDDERNSWNKASRDRQHGDLASLLTKEDAKISAEYLRMKLPNSIIGVWTSGRVDITRSNLSWSGDTALSWHGSNTFYTFLPLQNNTCLALRPKNYTYWDLVNCETQLLSLRSADLVAGNDFMCRCEGYHGHFCDSRFHGYYKYELKNPQSIECSADTLIYIEFAVYEYRAKGSTSTVCTEPNTLALLRYLCQGKNFCSLEPSVLKSYVGYVCDEINATLTVQHSCLRRHETTCPMEMIDVNQYGSKNCLLITHEKATWNETMKFCEAHGGQLVAFHDLISFRTISEYVTDLQNITTFWFFEQVPDLRPNARRPDVCTKAMIDSEVDATNLIVIRECSEHLHGLCAFPPYHHDEVHKYSIALHPTPYDKTENPTMETKADDTTAETKVQDPKEAMTNCHSKCQCPMANVLLPFIVLFLEVLS